MKKVLFVAGLLVALILTGCSKERTCKCTPTNPDSNEVTLVNTSGMSCSNITRLGFERQSEGQLVRRMEEVSCTDFVDE